MQISDRFKCPTKNMNKWTTIPTPKREFYIIIVGKYERPDDAYLSIKRAITHAAYAYNYMPKIDIVNSKKLDKLMDTYFTNRKIIEGN